MGVTSLVIEVANPAKPKATVRLEFIVDSGAVYSVVPAPVLRRLGIRPLKRETFRLANGTNIVRRKGGALFKFRSDGALTLEALGLTLDPIRRELRPMQLVL